MFIYPYNSRSKSVRNLKDFMGIKSIRRDSSAFKGSPDKIVINWGCQSISPQALKCRVMNKPDLVKQASNKLSFFNLSGEELNIPDFTTDKDVAYEWAAEGVIVVARTSLNGHSGDGVHVLECLEDFNNFQAHPEVGVYVKYIPKKDEYRVHIVNGKVIDVQRKAARRDYEGHNYRIRSHNNGFVYVREGVAPDPQVLEQAEKAIKLTGLDFGAVDVIWNNHRGKAYVLEINTAPGLEGQTVANYAKAFAEMSNDQSINEVVTKNLVLAEAQKGQPQKEETNKLKGRSISLAAHSIQGIEAMFVEDDPAEWDNGGF